jgi:hypothetical protein
MKTEIEERKQMMNLEKPAEPQVDYQKIKEEKASVKKQFEQLKKKFKKKENEAQKEFLKLKEQLEAVKLKAAEVHKTTRIIHLKMKEKERKFNNRQKLSPINHTPMPSSSSKLSNEYEDRYFRKLSKNRKSTHILKSVDTHSEKAYSSMESQGVLQKEKTLTENN